MQLYIDSYGASLGIKHGMFWVKPLDAEGQLIAILKVKTILLSKAVRVSTDALFAAIEHEIPVLLLDGLGRTNGLVWSGQYGSVSTIRKNQARFADHVQGFIWVRDLLIQKITNQQSLLQSLFDKQLFQGKSDRFAYQNAQQGMSAMVNRFSEWKAVPDADIKAVAATFRGWEGTASRSYFYCFSLVLQEEYEFKNRGKRPAYDRFNSCLNYMYGVLYGIIEVALVKAGIDPYMGVMHTDRYNKPTLVYDVIDQYRHWADEVALDLFLKEEMPYSCFQEAEKDGLWLSSEGKKLVVDAFTKQLNQVIDYKGNMRKRLSHIDLDAAKMATMFKFFNI